TDHLIAEFTLYHSYKMFIHSFRLRLGSTKNTYFDSWLKQHVEQRGDRATEGLSSTTTCPDQGITIPLFEEYIFQVIQWRLMIGTDILCRQLHVDPLFTPPAKLFAIRRRNQPGIRLRTLRLLVNRGHLRLKQL